VRFFECRLYCGPERPPFTLTLGRQTNAAMHDRFLTDHALSPEALDALATRGFVVLPPVYFRRLSYFVCRKPTTPPAHAPLRKMLGLVERRRG
jgi:hypothetical protein